MGRASAAQAAITRQKIIDAAFDITIHEGFDKATFSLIAKRAFISKSGINAHFDRKSDIAEALEPLFVGIIDKRLNYDSVAEFSESWRCSIDNDREFVAAIIACGPIISKERGIEALIRKIAGDEEEVLNCIYNCIGYAMVNIK